MACVVALLAGGCTAPDLGPELGAADDQPADEAPQDRDGDRDGEASDGGGPAAPEADPHTPDGDVPSCDDATAAAIDDVIGAQLAAFADGDYDRALELASEAFRADVDADDLARIIEEGYPVAADAAGHETGLCVQPTPTSAEVLVEVTAQDGTRGDLVYRMVVEEPEWRISGAVQVGEGPSEPTTPVVART